MSIQMAGPIAYLSESGSAVYFSRSSAGAGTYKGRTERGTAIPIKKLQNELNVAFWGEDNRFPQNIENQMRYCGIGKRALNWKAEALWGNGFIPGTITDYKDDGTEIFKPLKNTGANKVIYKFIRQHSMARFFLEFYQDWTWFGNCFPEIIFSKDCSQITGFVHQESCDSRFRQMNDTGTFDTVYLSKLWGANKDQYAQFDPKKAIWGLTENPNAVDLIDKAGIKTLDAIDMYNAVESARAIAGKLKSRKGLKSAILPVNYPSVNKTYYQVPAWDGARLAGWVEIASKIPSLLKTLYAKAFRIRYHIEVPENYFERKYGKEVWDGMDEKVQIQKRKDLLKEMDKFLSGDENAFKSFVSFFEYDKIGKAEHSRIKITEVPDTSKLDKEMISQSAADLQILIAMGIPPNIFGAGTIGTGQQRSGGSDLREAWLIYTNSLNLERSVAMEPMNLVRDFNGWDSDIVWRFNNIVLTTLDTGAGTAKTLS